jgi:hypothetical protein
MTTQNVQAAITELEAIDPNDALAYEKAILAYLRVQQIPYLLLELDPFPVFRSRTHDDEDFFGDISELSIPPVKVVRSFARCNKPFQPMFYCSDFRPTSYMELLEYWAENKNVGDELHVTISKWEITDPITALIITSPNAADRTSQYDQAHGHAIEAFINQYDGDYRDAMIMFYDFLFIRFRKYAKKDPLTYILTSAYCNLGFIKAAGKMDAVFYPSVPFQGQGVNFAFRGDFDFKSRFKPVLVAKNSFAVEAVVPNPGFKEIALIQTTDIDLNTGKINWQ